MQYCGGFAYSDIRNFVKPSFRWNSMQFPRQVDLSACPDCPSVRGGVERRTRCMALTSCFPCPYNFLTMCYMPIIDSKLRRGAVLGLLLFAYHTLTNCSPCPYNFLTICYMPRIDSKMRGGAVLGVLLFAYHTLTACSPCPYNVLTICPELTARCEGSRFGVAAVCVPCPDHLLPMS